MKLGDPDRGGSSYGIRLGTLLAFALIFPGFVGFGIYGFFFDTLILKVSLYEIITYIFGMGFVANAFGHFLDWIFYRNGIIRLRNRLLSGRNPYDFHDFPKRIYIEKDDAKRNAAEYHFAWFTFMFNSATILILLLISKSILTLIYEPITWSLLPTLKNLFVLVLSLICFSLAHFQMKVVHGLCPTKRSDSKKNKQLH